MHVDGEFPMTDVAPPTTRQTAPIIRCGENFVTVSLPSSVSKSSLSSTEARLVRFAEIGFRKIEVIADEGVASDPAVSAMLSRIAHLVAEGAGDFTIRTSDSQLIG